MPRTRASLLCDICIIGVGFTHMCLSVLLVMYVLICVCASQVKTCMHECGYMYMCVYTVD